MKGIFRSSLVSYAGDILFYLLILLIALALKAHYSTAGSDELVWILQPTAWLVEFVSGKEFIHEPGAGYMRSDNRFIIAPACAGVNFLITAFCMSAFYGIGMKESMVSKGLYILVSLIVSYMLTLLVNTLRIEVSIMLYSHQVNWGWLTLARVHRIAGIFIYFSSLVLLYKGLQKTVADTTFKYRGFAADEMTPFIWYSLVVIAVPVLNRGWQKGGLLFVEHCLMTFSVSLFVFLTYFLIKLMYFKTKDATLIQ